MKMSMKRNASFFFLHVTLTILLCVTTYCVARGTVLMHSQATRDAQCALGAYSLLSAGLCGHCVMHFAVRRYFLPVEL